MTTLHPEVQEIVDMLVELIREGEARVNVVDHGMMLARRLAPGTASKASTNDIPPAVSIVCTYDDDSAMLAYSYSDDIASGCRLANLAVDQIRFEDKVSGVKTPITPEEWLSDTVEHFKGCGDQSPRLEAAGPYGIPGLVVNDDAVRFLYDRMASLKSYLCSEISAVGNALGAPISPSKAETWLWQDPSGQLVRKRFAQAAEIAVLLAVYKELVEAV